MMESCLDGWCGLSRKTAFNKSEYTHCFPPATQRHILRMRTPPLLYPSHSVEREDEVLVEMRMFVPPQHVLPSVDMAEVYSNAKASLKQKRKGKAAAAAAAAGVDVEEEADDEEEEDDGVDASVVLHSLLTDAAGIQGEGGIVLSATLALWR